MSAPNARQVSRYECGCVFVARVHRNGGLIDPPHSPLNCPIHGAIWVNAYTVTDEEHEAVMLHA